jgi:hypothetical protein
MGIASELKQSTYVHELLDLALLQALLELSLFGLGESGGPMLAKGSGRVEVGRDSKLTRRP